MYKSEQRYINENLLTRIARARTHTRHFFGYSRSLDLLFLWIFSAKVRGVSPRVFAEFLCEISRRKKWSARTYAKSRGVFSAKVRV